MFAIHTVHPSKCFYFMSVADIALSCCYTFPFEIITLSPINLSCTHPFCLWNPSCKIHMALWWRCANAPCYLTYVNSFLKTLDKWHLTTLNVEPMLMLRIWWVTELKTSYSLIKLLFDPGEYRWSWMNIQYDSEMMQGFSKATGHYVRNKSGEK